MRRTILAALAALGLLAGCATPTLQGHAALSGGRYDEAARHFEEALADHPGRAPDLVGLGIARYKLGALDEAQRALAEAAAQAPDDPTPQLYLALIAIRRGDAAADTHLARYLQLGAPARLAGQLDRTRAALRGPLTPPMREYMAASLEDGYQWAGEVAAAVRAAQDAHLRWISAERIYLLPRACRCR
jgi:tetratricopeptide (TPR) repeat protein